MDITFIYPKNIAEYVCILFTAIVLDIVYPYHRGILYRVHPTHTAYVYALSLYRKLPKTKISGIVIWLIVVLSHIILYGGMLYIANKISRILWLAISIYVTKVSISIKLLINYVAETERCLEKGDIGCARETVSHIVRRDVHSLGEGHIASAALESLFENIVDSFTSPILFYLLLGPLGALIQRLVNTLDSALGYTDPGFREVGWMSAKADTYVNFVPARITALIIIALCPLIGGSWADSLKICLRDKRNTQSLNAGYPMSSASGCLSIKLEKIGFYTIGYEYPLPSYTDIYRGIKLGLYVATTFTVLSTLLYLLVNHIFSQVVNYG